MSARDLRVRIREISITGNRFDEAGFRRLVCERLQHQRAVDDRHLLRRSVADAARRAARDGDR